LTRFMLLSTLGPQASLPHSPSMSPDRRLSHDGRPAVTSAVPQDVPRLISRSTEGSQPCPETPPGPPRGPGEARTLEGSHERGDARCAYLGEPTRHRFIADPPGPAHPARGDTWQKISEATGVPVLQLRQLNPSILEGSPLPAGQTIRVR
jgi:hypothetical protein